MLGWYRENARRHLLEQQFPPPWLSFLAGNVAQYPHLSDQQQTHLRNDTRIIVAEKTWEGCGGLLITDEIKVTVAAQACLLLLGRTEHDYFARVRSILVYPTTFRVTDANSQDPYGEWHEGDPAAGQSVYRGPVILAWDAVLSEGRDLSFGSNVVIHEFAHQLDFLDGYTNGTPEISDDDLYDRWCDVMTEEFQKLQERVRKGKKTLLGDYAATSETEFFCVASEVFFTQPTRLRGRHPALYALLADYYRVNPVKWFE